MDDPIEIHNLQFGDWQSLCLCKEKKTKHLSVRCSDSNFIWLSQVSDGVTMLSNPTGNTIPALVPATTKKMVILFTFNRSNKPSSATYNWRATFSVTVFHLHHQFPWNFSCVVTLLFSSNFDRAKGVPVPLSILVTSIHSMALFQIQILKRSKERNIILFICHVNLRRVCGFHLRDKLVEICAPTWRQRAPVLSSLQTSPVTTGIL